MGKNGYLSPAEAAEILGVGLSTVYNWMRAGRIATCGSPLRCRRADVEYEAGLYSTKQVAETMRVAVSTVYRACRAGQLRAERGGVGVSNGYLLADMEEWWRNWLSGACVRCGILGEARAEWEFMCEACVHEKRTGRIYRWPISRNGRPRAVLRGSLAWPA